MSSPEGFSQKPAESFEQRMQSQYIMPMGEELEKIRNLFLNLDPESELGDVLDDIHYEHNTMPESSMDEDDLRKNLQSLRSTVERLQDPALTEDEKSSIAIEGVRSTY